MDGFQQRLEKKGKVTNIKEQPLETLSMILSYGSTD
jgi:hypothetical protein